MAQDNIRTKKDNTMLVPSQPGSPWRHSMFKLVSIREEESGQLYEWIITLYLSML